MRFWELPAPPDCAVESTESADRRFAIYSGQWLLTAVEPSRHFRNTRTHGGKKQVLRSGFARQTRVVQ